MKILINLLIIGISLNLFAATESTSTTSTTVSEKTYKSTKKKWYMSAFSLASTRLSDVAEGGASIGSYNYISSNWRLDKGYKFSVKVPFTLSTAGYDAYNEEIPKESEFDFQDLIIGMSRSSFVLLPFDTEVYWEGRIYLPTSENSKNGKMISRFRNDLIIDKPLHRHLSLEYTQKLNKYFYADTVSFNSFGSLSNNKSWYLDHWVSLNYSIDADLIIGWNLGVESTWYYQSVSENKYRDPKHEYKTGPAVQFSLNRNFRFIFNLHNVVEDRDDDLDKKFGKFNTEDVELTLLSFISFN